MKKILCPTDFSEASNNAIAYAGKLAQRLQGTVTLLHVQSVYDLSPTEIIRDAETATIAMLPVLEAQSEEVTRAFKVPCYVITETTSRKLSTVIRDNAQEFDLVVMGSNGPDDVYQLFFGTNTYNAITKSNTPVIVVPAGCVYHDLKSIVYAFDYLRNRALPRTQLLPLLQKFSTKLTVLQVMEVAYSQDAEDDLSELQYILSTYQPPELHVEYDTLHASDISASINEYVLKMQPDALALCSEHHGLITQVFHKSVIKNLTAICSYPIIVFQH
ncbi:universal stress protein [Parachryseolinea silvisoli]|uniref:universal stress protein n=1 Tax=Parachryseolinea silvisoli TaxID=2873601 RepID=UPI002265B92C|nr:universal stress protein [Parachryseolinea silvisoli]MCD9019172.1 universal stress protein [Parachryseolinea silvisoli]